MISCSDAVKSVDEQNDRLSTDLVKNNKSLNNPNSNSDQPIIEVVDDDVPEDDDLQSSISEQQGISLMCATHSSNFSNCIIFNLPLFTRFCIAGGISVVFCASSPSSLSTVN